MIVTLHNELSVGEINSAFQHAFPHLALAFFAHAHDTGKGSPWKEREPEDKLLSTLHATGLPGDIEIHAHHNTGTVEQEFERVFGLHVQVFRKEADRLVQTADSDWRTLGEQEEAAHNASQEWLDGNDKRFNDENPSSYE